MMVYKVKTSHSATATVDGDLFRQAKGKVLYSKHELGFLFSSDLVRKKWLPLLINMTPVEGRAKIVPLSSLQNFVNAVHFLQTMCVNIISN